MIMFRWFGNVQMMYERRLTKEINEADLDGKAGKDVDGHPSRSWPRKRWMGCVKDDIKIKGVSIEMTSGRKEWKKKTCCASSHSGISGR
jgi:hypothetical protein